MSRFTYTPWYDESGCLLGTTIDNTGGYFPGIPAEILAAHAESHYPVYSGANMSETFSEVYFNYTLRSKLRDLGLVVVREKEEDSLQP